MAKRRVNFEESLYQRASDGRWMGVVHFGYDAAGRPVRRYVSARTHVEAVRRLKELTATRDAGRRPPDSRLTLVQLLRDWHDEELPTRVVRSTADNYRSVYRHHVVPMLGTRTVAKLSLADVNRLLVVKLEEGLSPSTVQRIRNVLS